MELLQLRYFLESARTESFTKTAEKYMVPPSSVSITVRRLEKELGCTLFDRSANKIVLNENGRKLQLSLANIFGKLDQTVADLALEKEHVTIHVLLKSFRTLTVDAIIEYQGANPDICFKIAFTHDETKFENYDLIVTAEPISLEGFEMLQLCSHKLKLKVSPSSPLLGRPLVMEDLRDQPFLITSQTNPTYKALLRACENAGFTPNVTMEINDVAYYMRCVRAGLGIGITHNLDSYTLNVTDFNEWITCYAYYKTTDPRPQIQAFIDFLRCKKF